MKKKKYLAKGRLTEPDFQTVKRFLGKGLSPQDVHEVLGWGKITIRRIKQSESFAAYREMFIERAKPAIQAEKEEIEKELGSGIDDLIKILTKMSGQLESIETKIDEGRKKRGWF